MIPNDLPDLRDACPACPPGDAPAALPVTPAAEINGHRVADYQCTACETAWTAAFDRYGWPVERLIAPVAPEQAARHRDELAAELRAAA